MVLDTMRAAACPDNPAGRCLITISPPFPGARRSRMIQVCNEALSDWVYFAGNFSASSAVTTANLAVSGSPFYFQFVPDEASRWIIPAKARAAAGYTLK